MYRDESLLYMHLSGYHWRIGSSARSDAAWPSATATISANRVSPCSRNRRERSDSSSARTHESTRSQCSGSGALPPLSSAIAAPPPPLPLLQYTQFHQVLCRCQLHRAWDPDGCTAGRLSPPAGPESPRGLAMLWGHRADRTIAAGYPK